MAPSFRRVILAGLTLCLLLFSAERTRASITLGNGVGNGPLIGQDITDPYDKNVVGSTAASGFADATWISCYSTAKFFYGGESPCALFDNNLDGGNSKWYDYSRISSVTLQFPTSFTLTHFTLSTGNDAFPGRHPTEWRILGSNDGTNWTEIYVHPTGVDPFTTTLQTVLFTSFSKDTLAASGLSPAQQATVTDKLNFISYTQNYDADPGFIGTPTAYSWYKLDISNISNPSDRTQLGEWELFGFTSDSFDLMPITRGFPGGTSMFANAAFHMDAGNPDSLTITDGRVSVWQDATGRPIFMRQNDAARQPVLTLDEFEIGGETFPAIRFNPAESSRLERLLLDGTSNVGSLFIVNQLNPSPEGYVGLGGILGMNGQDRGIRMGYGDFPYWRTAEGNEFGISPGKYLYDGSATAKDIREPQLLTAITGGTHLTTNISLGTYFDGRYFDGYVAEVLAFSAELNDLETAIVHTYFRDKYGLPVEGIPAYSTGGFHGEQFFLANTENWQIANAGAGGFGIATDFTITEMPEGVDERSAFDLFYMARKNLPRDTVIMVTADSVSVPEDPSDMFSLWDKQWYIDISNPSSGDMPLVMGFDANDLSGTVDASTEWFLLYADVLGGPYTSLGSAHFDSIGAILFEGLFLASLDSGYYTLGTRNEAETPEPATWILMLLVLPLAAVAARKRKTV